MLKILLYVQCLVLALAIMAMAQNPIPVELCRPKNGLTKAICLRRKPACERDHGIILKWTGIGSRDEIGRPLRDGGCQCDGYCGFLSKKVCNSDSQCRWHDDQDACYTRGGDPGGPIGIC